MTENPNYYAIIPANVRYDERLKPNAKLLYGEITALANREGYCWASNSYFAKLYNVSSKTISEWISQLHNYKHITVGLIYKENSKEVDKRIIKITSPMEKKEGGYPEKTGGGIPKKTEDNNTSINNTSNISVKDEELFNNFWKEYGKPVRKQVCIKHWNKLTTEERANANLSVSNYLKVRPDKTYRRDPERYLRDKEFNDYLLVVKPKFKDY